MPSSDSIRANRADPSLSFALYGLYQIRKRFVSGSRITAMYGATHSSSLPVTSGLGIFGSRRGAVDPPLDLLGLGHQVVVHEQVRPGAQPDRLVAASGLGPCGRRCCCGPPHPGPARPRPSRPERSTSFPPRCLAQAGGLSRRARTPTAGIASRACPSHCQKSRKSDGPPDWTYSTRSGSVWPASTRTLPSAGGLPVPASRTGLPPTKSLMPLSTSVEKVISPAAGKRRCPIQSCEYPSAPSMSRSICWSTAGLVTATGLPWFLMPALASWLAGRWKSSSSKNTETMPGLSPSGGAAGFSAPADEAAQSITKVAVSDGILMNDFLPCGIEVIEAAAMPA